MVSARLVVLVSGAGTNLQALLDACADPAYGAKVVAVGADRHDTGGTARAERCGVPTFTVRIPDFPSRDGWDAALTEAVAAHEPDLVVSAGFMKILGPRFLARFGGRTVNTHPALLPSFPGAHAVREALAYGVKVTGCTVHFVDEGVDTGPVIAQDTVPVRWHDDEDSLHERIKQVERRLLVDVVGRLARDGWTARGRRVSLKCKTCGEPNGRDTSDQEGSSAGESGGD
ncbi:formyltetrahydrofolate-dependent phosphoribosylglycinamide formyltransferase [Actinomadura pelletieri DSM 43383]|uniref:Phosphoribosylglycinamide formyltransferase n=1 Tax=Actinomadura pelletieri DSM 43383 TaxID=1120940 RepID=A0A495QRY8_9ACTN|nr:phosphoribosylglycinamide formyltransferase [Actinomadura pelletieri]RKS76227.1 formyltetrahydrofolate-dependent phosphoribosylglycinamide formyltransferase [Actinomadura pelletieri DSM 43383]